MRYWIKQIGHARLQRIGVSICSVFLLAACAGVAPDQQKSEERITAPERATGYTEKSGWYARRYMVATANPHATQAGYDMLKAGGTAIDAAIAVQMVLTLVEPQSSGIGGGAFMLHFDGKQLTAYDGRETAPARATADLFQGKQGKALEFHEAVVGGRSVGVPGVVHMLEGAHRRHGKLPWKSLFMPAIQLAEKGFAVSPRLAQMLQTELHLKKDPAAAAYFYDRLGQPLSQGHHLRNPALADTLYSIAERGADAFYAGRIAQDMVKKVQGHPDNPGKLELTDLAAYRSKRREPVCSDYRRWTICGMLPPSSGGVTVGQIMGILEHTAIGKYSPRQDQPAAEAIHLFSEAGRLAYADRARYIADPDFAPLPGNSVAPLLSNHYLRQRAAFITDQSMGQAAPGNPFVPKAAEYRGMHSSSELPSTSHFSIVDGEGNAVSMTSSIEDAFGSRQMVGGFLLNNQLTDFSFVAEDAAGPAANRVQGNKRPRSSMAPTMVFEKDSKRLVMVLGSPGGSSIINYVAKVLVASLDWNMNVQDAINLPNFGSRNGPTELETGRIADETHARLRQKRHALRVAEQTSGVQAIQRIWRNGEPWWFAGADPRREGDAKGD